MKIQLQQNENIIKEGAANHFKGVESVGGKLFLTNQRLFFKSHSINFQPHELSILYKEIKSVGKRNTLLIVPNGMYIELKDGSIENFVVWSRRKWIEEIEQKMQE